VRDVRGAGLAGTIGALVASGEPVVVLVACAERRLRALHGRLGGFALCSWDDLERDPGRAARAVHLVALDPPPGPAAQAALERVQAGRTTHLAWGGPELDFTQDVLEHDAVTRPALQALYRDLRDRPGAPLEDVLLAGRTAVHAGRLLRVLDDLGLAAVERGAPSVTLVPAERTDLERSAAYRAYRDRTEEALRWLSRASVKAA
jgi:single-stranded-DNA-specific exonuclease